MQRQPFGHRPTAGRQHRADDVRDAGFIGNRGQRPMRFQLFVLLVAAGGGIHAQRITPEPALQPALLQSPSLDAGTWQRAIEAVE